MSADATAKQRIEKLRREIERHSRLYYVDAAPEISDHQFDRLLGDLASLEADNPELVTADSPTQRVGGEPLDGFVTVTHARPMLSIDNTYDREELAAWVQRVEKGLGGEGELFGQGIKYIVEPKIDGVAVNLRYEAGVLTLATTRGDGRRGDDITLNARAIPAIPLHLATNMDHFQGGVLEIRGEAYMSEQDFAQINAARTEAGEEQFANPRNATAGTLKQLDPKEVAKRPLLYFAHGRGEITDDPYETHSRFLEAIRQMGLPVNPFTRTFDNLKDVWAYIEEFDQKRSDLPYATDGMVIKVDRVDQQNKIGVTSKAPRWCIAYKYPAEQAVTRLLDVEWQVGKTGKLTPRATMEPVNVARTTVQHATLHNLDEIQRKDIRIGDTVVIEKAGEIIPQVVEVVKDKRPKDSQPIEPPAKCPSCRGPIVQVEDEVAHRCINPECPAQFREKLIWFAARGQMDIDGLGEKAVHQLADAGVLETFGDIFLLKDRQEQLLQLERMGRKKIENLLAGIEQAKQRGLARVLAGLGIRHVGAQAARVLAEHMGSIDAIRDESVEGLARINEIGPITAESIHQFLHSDAGRHVIEELKQADVKMTAPRRVEAETASALAGKTIVITGTLEGFDRKGLTEELQSLGAKVTSSVSKNTDLLIAGESPGSKLDKARELGVEVWDEAELAEAIRDK